MSLPASLFVALAVQQTPALATESRLIAAFTTICLEHMGDAAAQAAAAAAAPWSFAADGPATDAGAIGYRSGSTRLGIGERTGLCTLTGELEPRATLASVRSAMTAAIGTDEGQPLAADSRYWLIADARDQEHVLALKVSNATGQNLATLWIQRRATLSRNN